MLLICCIWLCIVATELVASEVAVCGVALVGGFTLLPYYNYYYYLSS